MGRGSVFFSCRQSHPSLAHVSGGVCSRVCFPFSDSVLHCVPCPRPRLSHILLRRTWALQPLCPYLCVNALAACALRRYPPPHCVHVPGPRPCIGAVLRRCPWPLPTTSAPLALYQRRHPLQCPLPLRAASAPPVPLSLSHFCTTLVSARACVVPCVAPISPPSPQIRAEEFVLCIF